MSEVDDRAPRVDETAARVDWPDAAPRAPFPLVRRVGHLRLVKTDVAGLAPYADGLARLEQGITYPVGDGADHFQIDHGPSYHPFFSSMGDAHFLLALDGDEVVGNVTGVVRTLRRRSRAVHGLYVCDLKVAPRHRGTGLARRMLLAGLASIARDPRTRKVRLLYGAAMRGAAGDVRRSARGLNPLKLGRSVARLSLYFVHPEQLAVLRLEGAPPPPRLDLGLDLSPDTADAWADTAGRKDLRLQSTGDAWPLVHLPLGPASWGGGLGAYLQRCGQELVARGVAGPACFGLDQRLEDHVAWLQVAGIAPGATCTVYSLSLVPSFRKVGWVHLATSEI
ncbi:MAG TPA: GNAT family N-acetyltransferase [Vulgatibacter sp.]